MSVPTTGGTGDFKADGTVALTGQVTTNVGTFASAVANGASAKGFSYNTPAYTTTAKLVSWANNASEKAYIQQDGVFCSVGNGSETSPIFKGSAGRGFYEGIGGIVFTDGTARMVVSSTQLQMTRAALIGWNDTAGSVQTFQNVQTGFGWNAAGVVEINNGTAGTFRDIKVRNSIATGNTALGIVAKTANYTVTANDGVIECDATTGAITLTLPAVATATAGTTYTLKKTDASANAVIFDGNAAETIDGAATVQTTTQYASITIIRNAAGTAWLTLKD